MAAKPSKLVFKSLPHAHVIYIQQALMYLKLLVNCHITFSGDFAGP